MNIKHLLAAVSFFILLTACSSFGMGGMMGDDGHMDGMGMDNMQSQVMEMMSEENMELMRARHNMGIPEEYAGLTNPIEPNEESLARGKKNYLAFCVSCHGETGMGEGSLGETLDPRPAPIALSSQMTSDAYWFWRVSEGGAEFGSAMPGWKGPLSDENIWDLLNYVRSLGK